MFDTVLRAEAAWRAVPVGTVVFRQRGRDLFARVTGREVAPPSRDGEGREPVVVPVRQRDRRLFQGVLRGPSARGQLVGRPGEAESAAPPAIIAVASSGWDLFSAVMRRDAGRRAARRGTFALAASALQAAVVGGAVLLSDLLAAHAQEEVAVPVEIVPVRMPRAAPRAPPPPPAAPPGFRRAGPARPRPPGAEPLPPAALVQPREVAPEMRMPGPDEPSEDLEWAYAEGGEGVVGGIVGAAAWNREELAGRGRGEEIVDAPQYATAGFRRPAEAEPGCLRRSIRLPSELAGYVSGPVTVKFAVGRDGSVGAVQILGQTDPRIAGAIQGALRACRWLPGADARGQPVSLWVILPLRFESD
jgi:protein TonB